MYAIIEEGKTLLRFENLASSFKLNHSLFQCNYNVIMYH